MDAAVARGWLLFLVGAFELACPTPLERSIRALFDWVRTLRKGEHRYKKPNLTRVPGHIQLGQRRRNFVLAYRTVTGRGSGNAVGLVS